MEIGNGPDIGKSHPYQCQLWGAIFTDNWHLQQHQFTGHIVDQPKQQQQTTTTEKVVETLAIGNDSGGKSRSCECPDCGARFSDSWHLQRHQYTHTVGQQQPKPPTADKKMENGGDGNASGKLRPYQCDAIVKPGVQCEARFTDKWHLQRHQYVHTGERPPKHPSTGKKMEAGGDENVNAKPRTHQCLQCEARFTDKWHLQRHMYTHTGDRPKSMGGKKLLEIGGDGNVSLKPRPYQCEAMIQPGVQCDARFTDKWHLQRHMYTHTGDRPKPTPAEMMAMGIGPDGVKLRPYVCPDCGDTFTDKWHLQRHQFTHIGGECDFCGKQFTHLDRLNSHRRLHTGEKPSRCKLCTYRGRTSEHVKRHMASKHNDERSFSCFECSKSFKRKDHLFLHFFTHNPDKKQFKCTVCPLTFSTPYKLTRHMVSHSDERSFFCNVCYKTFKRKDKLSLHYFTHNPEKKQFGCSVCERKFSTPYNLKQHMDRHSEERPFSCYVCGKRFKRKDKLSLHFFTHNPDKKPFQCSMCTLKFSTSYRLKQHMVKHSDEKQFSCEQCGKAFKRKDKLNRHLSTHGSSKSDTGEPCAACAHTCFQHQPCSNRSTSSTSQPAYRQPTTSTSQLYRQPVFPAPVSLIQQSQK